MRQVRMPVQPKKGSIQRKRRIASPNHASHVRKKPASPSVGSGFLRFLEKAPPCLLAALWYTGLSVKGHQFGQSSRENAEMAEGTIKTLTTKGFGFIKTGDEEELVFPLLQPRWGPFRRTARRPEGLLIPRAEGQRDRARTSSRSSPVGTRLTSRLANSAVAAGVLSRSLFAVAAPSGWSWPVSASICPILSGPRFSTG